MSCHAPLTSFANMTGRSTAPIAIGFGIFALAFQVGCSRKIELAPQPPVEVDVQEPVIKDAEVFIEFPAQTEAVARVEVRARVKGFLRTRDFQPGQYVEKDETLLFTIEPDQFEAAVRSAEGNLAQADANEEIQRTNYERRKQAVASGAVSEIEMLSAKAEYEGAQAAKQIAEAALEDAKRDLRYTIIKAPVTGRVSREEVDIGNLVGANEPTLLTTVVQDDPIFADFEVSERVILPYLSNRSRPEDGGEFKTKKKDIRIVLSDGSEYPVRGNLDFIDNAINPATGTIPARAKFDNEEGALAAGLFVRVGIPEVIKDAVLVPRFAIQRDLGGDFVLLVGGDNEVERRLVTPTRFTEGEFRIIEGYNEESGTGVKKGERVIVSNLQRARPGVKVAPVEASNEKAASAADPAAADGGGGDDATPAEGEAKEKQAAESAGNSEEGGN